MYREMVHTTRSIQAERRRSLTAVSMRRGRMAAVLGAALIGLGERLVEGAPVRRRLVRA